MDLGDFLSKMYIRPLFVFMLLFMLVVRDRARRVPREVPVFQTLLGN